MADWKVSLTVNGRRMKTENSWDVKAKAKRFADMVNARDKNARARVVKG